MTELLKKNKTLLIILVIVIVAFIGYTIIFNPGEDAGVLTSKNITTRGGGDNQLLLLLVNLRSITLDDSLFRDPAFRDLIDFGQQLTPEPTGRQNPFAPVGSDSI